MRRLIDDGAQLALTEIVFMEVLAGAPTRLALVAVRAQLSALPMISAGLADYEAAARLYRGCRRRGETIRNMADRLIAAVAIRSGARVLHRDRDFDAIARHSSLRIHVPERG
jgi:hypothetical protein